MMSNSSIINFKAGDWVEPVDLKVLVLEDDRDDELLISRTLKSISSYNFDISVAETLKEAKDLIRKNYFHVAFIDYVIEDDYGIDIIPALITANPQCIPVLLSGQITPEVHRRALEVGVLASLSKDGLSGSQLETTLRQAFHSQHQKTQKDTNQPKQKWLRLDPAMAPPEQQETSTSSTTFNLQTATMEALKNLSAYDAVSDIFMLGQHSIMDMEVIGSKDAFQNSLTTFISCLKGSLPHETILVAVFESTALTNDLVLLCDGLDKFDLSKIESGGQHDIMFSSQELLASCDSSLKLGSTDYEGNAEIVRLSIAKPENDAKNYAASEAGCPSSQLIN